MTPCAVEFSHGDTLWNRMRDEELAARVGLTTKDVAKIANKLAEDGFLAT